MSNVLNTKLIESESPLPIGVCVICGKEEERIKCLVSHLKGIAKEIIIVQNSDIVDQTAYIAETLGAKVFKEPWKGFIGQKNSAAQKITQPWILNLDADEMLSDALKLELKTLFNQKVHLLNKFHAFSMPRLTYFQGKWIKHGDWYPDRQTRLWRKGYANWTGEEPHAILKVYGRIGKLRAPILHCPVQSLELLFQKTLYYSKIFALEHKKKGCRKIYKIELMLRPLWRFIRSYILRMGFLDGWQGFEIAFLGAIYTFLRYSLALENQQKHE